VAWSLFVLVVVGFLRPPGALSYPVFVGFEGPQPSFQYYGEKGFYFTSSGFFGPSFLLGYGFDDSRAFPISGKYYATFFSDQGGIHFSNTLGRAFSMVSVDLAEYSTFFHSPIDVTFIGHRKDDSAVTQTFTIDGVIDGSGPLQDFQRFYFGPQFTNLYRVDVERTYDVNHYLNAFCMDNVVVDVAGTNILPTISLLHPTSGAFVPGQTIAFAADAADADGDVVAVEYLKIGTETNVLGRSTTAPFGINISTLEEGPYTIAARATDNFGGTRLSATRFIRVTNQVNTGTLDQNQPNGDVSISLPSNLQFAQTFVPEISGLLYNISITLGPDDQGRVFPVTLEVTDTVNGVPGTNLLASSTLSASSISPALVQRYSFPFITKPFLQERIPYALRLSSPAPIYGMRVGFGQDNEYPGGQLWQRQTNSTWGPVDYFGTQTTQFDLIFASYMIPRSQPLRIHRPMHLSSFAAGTPVEIEARTSGSLSNIERVEFYGDAQLLGITTNTIFPSLSSFYFTWTNPAAGTHIIDVKAFSGADLLQAASPVSISIVLIETNHAPSFTKGPDFEFFEDADPPLRIHEFPNWATSIVPGPTNELAQQVFFLLAADNPALFTAQPAINASGTLAFALAPNANGTANVTVVLQDDGGIEYGGADTSLPQIFSVTVLPVNDPPTFTGGRNVTVYEDSGTTTVAGWATNIRAGPADESNQRLSTIATNDNPGLFSAQPTVDTNGTLSLSVLPDAAGDVHVTVWFRDDGGVDRGGMDTSAPYSFVIWINQVNDPPSFTPGTNVVVLEDAGIQTLTNWATGISTGPNESWQPINFVALVDHPEKFSLTPAVTPEGTLTFNFKPNSNGTAVVRLFAYDSDCFYCGGSYISSTQTFTITATAVYDPPVLTLTSPTNGAIFPEGQNVPLSVSALYIESTLTNVEFLATGTRVAQAATDPYTGIWTNTTAGLYTLTARGTDSFGEATNSPPITVVINARPEVTLTSPTTSAIYLPGQSITLTAVASDSDGWVTRIELFDRGILLGSSSTSPLVFAWTNASTGTHSLTAQAIDNFGANRTSTVVTVTVARPPRFNSGGIFTLVADSSFWRYLDTGPAPADWRRLDFDDSAWHLGAAEFGFGDGDEVTAIVGRSNLVTVYFRQPFFVTNRTSLGDLTVSLLRDDGGVVYLNEREIFRSNMPTGAIAYTTFPVSDATGLAETTFYSTNVDLNLLTNGWNILAVEIHQSGFSMDLSFDLRLFSQPIHVALDRVARHPDGSVVLEFASLADRLYTVEYSSDLIDWKTSIPQVQGNGGVVSWTDSGPPVTDTPPDQRGARFYRVRLEP